ncbi:UbiA family prenyltransferase [Candidatus Bathyarchaeota archaeon]|nr:UbiA family prenyltransferase [Candidatus Bathyarchaeota archaeon]
MDKLQIKGLIQLLRVPYWLMTGGLSLLTGFAIAPGLLDFRTALLIFFSMAFITSAGFAINDYYDKESDAVIKPKRPIPSGALSLKQVLAIVAVLFALGLSLALLLNWLCFAILLIDSILLLFYSSVLKRKSGVASNILVGLLVGTGFIYGEAGVLQTISLISLSLYPICFGTIGGNILRDILSLEGDSRIGYPTLPKELGKSNAAKIAAFSFIITATFSPLPYVIGGFSIYYLAPMLLWSLILYYCSIRLVTLAPTIENIRKYERIVTMSMILLPLSLILEGLAMIPLPLALTWWLA